MISDFSLENMSSKTGKDDYSSPSKNLFYIHELLIKYFKVFSQWIKEIERELNQIQEKHGITPELVRKIIDDAKKLNK